MLCQRCHQVPRKLFTAKRHRHCKGGTSEGSQGSACLVRARHCLGVLVTQRSHCCSSVQTDQKDHDKVWTQTGCRTEAEMRWKTHGQGNPNALISDSVPYSPAPDCSKKAANSPRHARGRHRGARPAEKALPGDHVLNSACVERGEAGVVTSLSTCGGQPPGREPAGTGHVSGLLSLTAEVL